MEYQKEDLDYQVSLNSFSQEIIHKIMLIDKHTFDFQNLISQSINSGKCAIQMVKFSRKVIEDIERIVIGMKGYLQQLNIGNFYNLIFNMFRILILCFNSLCQKFINILKNRKITQQNQDQTIQVQSKQSKSHKKSKKQAKQMQYLDFVIKSIEIEEQKIEQQRKIMEKQLRQQSKFISKITASDTVNQLQNLNKQIQKIINNSYRISGQNVLYRYQQLSKKILSFKKPEQIQNQFYNIFGCNMRKKFFQGMQKIIKQLYTKIRYDQKQKIKIQIFGQKPKLQVIGVQTQNDLKIKQIDQLNKQKKYLNNQIDALKKINNILQKQVQKISDKFRQSKQSSRNYQKKIGQLQNQVKKKTSQFSHSKLQYQRIIDNFNKNKFKESSQTVFTQFHQDIKFNKKWSVEHKNLTENDDQNNNNRKNINRRKQIKKSSYLALVKKYSHENKQNKPFIKGLEHISQKLAEIDLINEQQLHELIKKIQSGNFQSQLQNVLLQFSQNLINISDSRQKIKDINKVSHKIIANLKLDSIKLDSMQKQTQTQLIKDTNQLFCNWKQQKKQNQIENNKTQKKISKLEIFKQQFLQKVSLKKTQSSLIKNNGSKYYKKYNDIQRKQFKFQHQSSDHAYLMEQNDQNKNQKIGKAKLFFNTKDISFEEFKLAKVPNKSNMLEKKYLTNKIKKKQNILTETHNSSQQVYPKKPIFSLENYQVLKQVKLVSDMLCMKNDKNNNFMKAFLQNILQQVKKLKGDTFIQQLFSKQLLRNAQKQERPSIKITRPKYINLEINTVK